MKKYNPTTAGRRGMSVISYKSVVTASKPEKSLTKGFKRGTGRNNQGRITTRHKGGGVKRNYREIDFKYNKFDIPAKFASIEYDPNRSAYISLVVYADGEKRYVVTPKGISVGDSFLVSQDVPVEIGNRMILRNIPCRYICLQRRDKTTRRSKDGSFSGKFLTSNCKRRRLHSLKMPSTEVRKVVDTCFASVGVVSNDEWKLVNFGKAGRNRRRGIRPTVRGTVMNPVDHPHGGGEGRQGIGLRRGPKTAQGKLAYGVKTRTPKKYSNKLIVTRRKTKR